MATVIDTAPAASDTINDLTVGDTIFVADGPPESGFQTTQLTLVNGTLNFIFANKIAVTIDGQNQGDNVVFDNPDPAFGMQSLTIQNLGTGGSINGGNPNAGGADIAVFTLSLQAGSGIGTAARPLRTQVDTLRAVTGTGGIFITNGVNAPVTLNIGNGSGGVQVTGASGDISLINNGTIDSFSSV